jgi:hypothetical protein
MRHASLNEYNINIFLQTSITSSVERNKTGKMMLITAALTSTNYPYMNSLPCFSFLFSRKEEQ